MNICAWDNDDEYLGSHQSKENRLDRDAVERLSRTHQSGLRHRVLSGADLRVCRMGKLGCSDVIGMSFGL